MHRVAIRVSTSLNHWWSEAELHTRMVEMQIILSTLLRRFTYSLPKDVKILDGASTVLAPVTEDGTFALPMVLKAVEV